MDRPKTPARAKTPGPDRSKTPFERAKTPGGAPNRAINEPLRLRPPAPMSPQHPEGQRFIAQHSNTGIYGQSSTRARTMVAPRPELDDDVSVLEIGMSFRSSDAGRDQLIERLKVQVEEAEARRKEAEARAAAIEQRIREEVADEMDARLAQMLREAREDRKTEGIRSKKYVEEKIAILKKGIVGEVQDRTSRRNLARDLEEENAALRRELAALKGAESLTKKKTGAVLGGIKNAV